MFKFETRVHEIVAEMQEPLTTANKSIMAELKTHTDNWVELEAAISKATKEMQRAQAALTDFTQIGPRMDRLTQKQTEMNQKMFDDHQHSTAQVRALTAELNTARRDFDEVRADVNGLLRKDDAITAALSTVAEHREKLEKYVDGLTRSNEARWQVKDAEYAAVAAEADKQATTQ